MILIKNIECYSPDYLGKKDILISNTGIVKIQDKIESDLVARDRVIDGNGRMAVPGFIDQHVHIIGGGGEAGYASRIPEILFDDLIQSGITTVVGLLGTDGITRNIETLYAKAKQIEEQGISTYILSGSYGYPPTTITGCVKKDIMFIDKVLGVKIAISDHRSSHLTSEELIRLASDVRIAGILSNKIGIIHLHVGRGKEGLSKLFDIIENTDLPSYHFIPTHVGRDHKLLRDAIAFAKKGGAIDITAMFPDNSSSETLMPGEALKTCIANGVAPENISFSSDGNGSIPVYDNAGKLTGIGIAKVQALFYTFQNLIFNDNMAISDALIFFTRNIAKRLGIRKGQLREGFDADILLLDKELKIDIVIAKGQIMIENNNYLIHKKVI